MRGGASRKAYDNVAGTAGATKSPDRSTSGVRERVRLIITGGVLIALQLATWGGCCSNPDMGSSFDIGVPIVTLLFRLSPVVAIPFVLRWPKGRAGGVAVMVGVFLWLNDARLGFGTWAGATVVMCGVLAILDGFRTRSRETDLIELRNVVFAFLAMALMLLLTAYVIPLLYASR
jgi:hypothetical protein